MALRNDDCFPFIPTLNPTARQQRPNEFQSETETISSGFHRNRPEHSPEILSRTKSFKYAFIIDALKAGAGGNSILYIDGAKVAEGHIPKTVPFIYSGYEGVDVGMDNETNVSNEYKEGGNKFAGKIKKLRLISVKRHHN